MVANGITRTRLPAGNEVICTLDDGRVPRQIPKIVHAFLALLPKRRDGGRFRNRSPAEPNEHRIQRHSAAGGNAYDTADPCSGTEPNDHSRTNFARA